MLCALYSQNPLPLSQQPAPPTPNLREPLPSTISLRRRTPSSHHLPVPPNPSRVSVFHTAPPNPSSQHLLADSTSQHHRRGASTTPAATHSIVSGLAETRIAPATQPPSQVRYGASNSDFMHSVEKSSYEQLWRTYQTAEIYRIQK
ncbi:uncharacterized protein LOC107636801 isoform X2 [Arachis ipaensis]|uniref:uncharacterized protein LOC107636801 isoform X2 n=1 Tax=Arachis ipaensis TaxID=130454 RepID=UPI000A2B7077|nr:uncharacterized protein LOC107636801 isoform X2 [Arachis ipaensis]XP_025648982.1 uncharacterized protein LOC112743837 isoform X1 [Arachis hypogaea]